MMVLQLSPSPNESNDGEGRRPKPRRKLPPRSHKCYPYIPYNGGLVHLVVTLKVYSFVFILISCFVSVIRFRIVALLSLQSNHDDSNALPGIDTVSAFHAGEWAGSPVVEVVI